RWQATQFKNKSDIDGILGPGSWKILKPLLSVIGTSVQTPSRWRTLIKGADLCPAKHLVDGEETFKAMVDAIKTANGPGHYIYILGWMLDVNFLMVPGDPSSSLKNLLTEAARKKVEIRALVWDNPAYAAAITDAEKVIDGIPDALMFKDNTTFGSAGIQKAVTSIKGLIATFKKAVAFAFPVGPSSVVPIPGIPQDSILDMIPAWTNFEAEINALHNEGSHHEKVLIVKGQKGLIGFCGGLDINPDRITGVDSIGRSTIMHDVHCELHGHAVWELLQGFLRRWDTFKIGKLPYINPRVLLPLKGQNEPEPPASSPDTDTAYVKILHTYNHPVDTSIRDRGIHDELKIAIMNARESVYLEDQYVISQEIASWLNLKLKEPGFKNVTILTQDDEFARGDLLFPQDMRKKFIDQLCNGLDAATIRQKVYFDMLDPGGKPANRHEVHSKMYIIDGQTDDPLAIIGTANCSFRSMTFDSETNAFIFNDKGSQAGFVANLNFRLNYDDKISRIKYQPNPKIKDRDVQLHDDIENFINQGSFIKQILIHAVGIDSFLNMLDNLLASLKPLIIDLIDPNADNMGPRQELPEHAQEWGQTETTNFEETTAAENAVAWEDEHVRLRDEALIEQGTDMETREPEYEDLVTTQGKPNSTKPAAPGSAKVSAPPVNKPCEGYVCWAKTVLNKLLGLSLTDDNRIDAATKQALENFQVKNNLSKTGKLDPATERTLLEADSLQRYTSLNRGPEAAALLGGAKTKIEDWTSLAINNKPSLILDSYRDPRKLWAFVLHHMAFKRKSRKTGQFSDPASYLTTGAHFCIMFDGRIAQLYPLAKMIWHAQCTSPRSVSVEFEGNFPNIHGQWWIDKDGPNRDHPTDAQYEAGRFLASYLQLVLGTTHILAHRQSADSRENDPGPDIWYNVGQWAVEHLGMTDGGDFKCGTGHPIPPEWRTWGKNKTQEVSGEQEEETMNEFNTEEEFGNQASSGYAGESEIKDLSRATRLNRYYATQLGWLNHQDQINDLLLPYSGLSNVSLGEDDFARAVYSFQLKNGLIGDQADGIIGPGTWAILSRMLHITAQAKNGDQVVDGVLFKKKPVGWDVHGGGMLKDKLQELRQNGKLSISQNELETFLLVSIPETDGFLNSVNSWDSAYMSMGFFQFTILYGELQQVIMRCEDVFKKYGIELDRTHLYSPSDRYSFVIKNAPNISDLRSLDWAIRFYRAGLEDEVVIQQVKQAQAVMSHIRSANDPNKYLDRFQDQYPHLWAFVFEAYNSRSHLLNEALASAVATASHMNFDDPVQFGKTLIAALKVSTTRFYSSPNTKYRNSEDEHKHVKDELDKIDRIITKTGIAQ
ncbi:MAG TPA: N-acetylmuramoyl-L-alanine amidase, partial [Puia sp.]|nr:N-acetylmuramoyl-L-alanine amidase [Puia sp.]